MSNFWHWWIVSITLGMIFFCWWLLEKTKTMEVDAQGETNEEGVRTTGHIYDGIEEYDNPLPIWWLYMFYISIALALGYLALYPGLGNYKGLLGWTSANQWLDEVENADDELEPFYAQFADRNIQELAQDDAAVDVGRSLFLTYCTVCHGSDAKGFSGFPNLTDNDWLYGGEPDEIVHSITNGRNGNMPPMAAGLGGDEGVEQLAHYVLSLSGREDADATLAAAGQPKFAVCAACHGTDGKGNKMLGAPNLTDEVWLYGGTVRSITQTINEGRGGVMPSHKSFLNETKISMLATYIYSLSDEETNETVSTEEAPADEAPKAEGEK